MVYIYTYGVILDVCGLFRKCISIFFQMEFSMMVGTAVFISILIKKGISFDSKLEGKLSPRSYFIQFER